jgi:hypothetical protein
MPLHPFLVGQPHRIEPFAEALRYIAGSEGVWLATGREIARHFVQEYYDAFSAAASRGQVRGAGAEPARAR